MLYLADLVKKDVILGDESCGRATPHYDNATKKCALKIGEQFFVGNISVGEKLRISNATIVPLCCDNTGNVICQFGELSVGQRVYDLNGKYLGEVENAEFSTKFVLKKIWVQDAEFRRGQIFSIGDAVIIRAKTPKQILAQQARALRTEKTPEQPVSKKIEPQNTPIGYATLPSAQHHALNTEVYSPHGQIRRRYGNFNFLLGKVADKTIVNFQGEVMIKKGERVTREILRQAKISGKLIELYLHVE